MSPNNSEVQPAVELSPKVVERPLAGRVSAEKAPSGAERAPAPERSAQSAPAALSFPTIPLPTPPTLPGTIANQPAVSTSTSTSTAQDNNPAQASDDNDLIEKEWVNKAKQIVESTRDDPYKQSEELTIFKADYMKKRYNKTIKLNN